MAPSSRHNGRRYREEKEPCPCSNCGNKLRQTRRTIARHVTDDAAALITNEAHREYRMGETNPTAHLEGTPTIPAWLDLPISNASPLKKCDFAIKLQLLNVRWPRYQLRVVMHMVAVAVAVAMCVSILHTSRCSSSYKIIYVSFFVSLAEVRWDTTRICQWRPEHFAGSNGP